jgi:hypothetical protein
VAFDSEGEARFMVMGMGASVEVLEPTALREHVRGEAEKIVGRKGR